jgi:hypothetical protein
MVTDPLQLPATLLPLGWAGWRHGDRISQALAVDPRRESAYKICELLGSIVVTRGSCPVDFGRQGPDSVQFVQRPYPRTAATGRGAPMLLSFDAAPSRAGSTTRLALRLLGNSETAAWLVPFPQTRQRPHEAAKNAEAAPARCRTLVSSSWASSRLRRRSHGTHGPDADTEALRVGGQGLKSRGPLHKRLRVHGQAYALLARAARCSIKQHQ